MFRIQRCEPTKFRDVVRARAQGGDVLDIPQSVAREGAAYQMCLKRGVSHEDLEDAECILRGSVVAREDPFATLSFDGLFGRLRDPDRVCAQGAIVYVTLSRSRQTTTPR